MYVLAFHGRTSLKLLNGFIGTVPFDLYNEAITNGLQPSGPQYWIYKGSDGIPETMFDLSVCLPVALMGKTYRGEKFSLEKLDSFNCVSQVHQGDWRGFKATYESLYRQMNENNLIPGLFSREVYMNCDFEHPENNITDIQIAVL